MNMTRKRSPRKKRPEHGNYFTFDLWTSIITIAVTLMITSSCAVAISYQHTTTYITDKSNQEKSVSEKRESRKYSTNNLTESLDSSHKQHTDTWLYYTHSVTDIPDVPTSSPTENIVSEPTTSYAVVTSALNMIDNRETNINGSTASDYVFITESNHSIEPIINESINLNVDLRNATVNNYTDESNPTTQNISKGIICFTNDKNAKDGLCDRATIYTDIETGSVDENISTYINTNVNKNLQSILNNTSEDFPTDGITNKEFVTDKETQLEDYAVLREQMISDDKLQKNNKNDGFNTFYINTDTDIHPNNNPIILDADIKLQDNRTRSGKILGGRYNKNNYEIKSRSYENNVIKDNSDRSGNNNLNSNLDGVNTAYKIYCSDCREDNHTFDNMKSDSVIGSSKSSKNNKKVTQIQIDYDHVDGKWNNNSNGSIVNRTSTDATYDVLTDISEELPGTKYATNKTMTEIMRDEGAFYAIRVLAQGVLESVAERIVPAGILDLFKRIQNQSTTLESERLRSKTENGGLGNWGRSILRSVLADPLNQFMQGARDNGSLDSNRNFLSGVASGVVYVADSVAESFKDRVKAIYPGTLWCGDGDVARSNEVGLFYLTDLCCKNHDTCKHYIRAGDTKFGLINTGIFSRSHCSCDKAFYRCLKKTNSIISTQIGVTFFSILGPQCFKKDYPIVRCVRRTRLTGQKCEEYELDRNHPKIWQWFDSPTF